MAISVTDLDTVQKCDEALAQLNIYLKKYKKEQSKWEEKIETADTRRIGYESKVQVITTEKNILEGLLPTMPEGDIKDKYTDRVDLLGANLTIAELNLKKVSIGAILTFETVSSQISTIVTILEGKISEVETHKATL